MFEEGFLGHERNERSMSSEGAGTRVNKHRKLNVKYWLENDMLGRGLHVYPVD